MNQFRIKLAISSHTLKKLWGTGEGEPRFAMEVANMWLISFEASFLAYILS
jgi:hypothetical protein